jgi:hypothetical protein
VKAEILAKGGELIAGAPLHCRSKVSRGAQATFQWSRGDGTAWEKIEGATACEYVPGDADVGFVLLCSIVAVDSHGWRSARLNVQTGRPVDAPAKTLLFNDADWPIVGGAKKVIAGITIATTLKDASLSKANLRWEREMGLVWEEICTADRLLVTCNDIGHRLRAVTSKGLMSTPTPEVEFGERVWSSAQAQIKARHYTFKAKAKLAAVEWTLVLSESGIALTNNKGVAKTGKWSDVFCEAVETTEDEMVLWVDPATKFVLIPEIIDKRLAHRVKRENVRDFTVLVVTGLKQTVSSGQ